MHSEVVTLSADIIRILVTAQLFHAQISGIPLFVRTYDFFVHTTPSQTKTGGKDLREKISQLIIRFRQYLN